MYLFISVTIYDNLLIILIFKKRNHNGNDNDPELGKYYGLIEAGKQ